jgi:plastocyanin
MRKIFVLIAVLMLLGTACGKSSTKATTGSNPPVALDGTVNDGKLGEAKNGAVTIEQDDFYFNPAYTKAPAGSAVTVTLKNEGTVKHTFTIDALSVDQEVDAGKSVDVKVTLPASGAVEYYCRFHVGQGMHGAFYSKAGDTLAGAQPSGAIVTTSTTAYKSGY